MNLYLFNDNDSAAVYGIGTYIKELTLALEESEIHVHIVHLHSVRPKFEIVKTNQVEEWYIPEIRKEKTLSILEQWLLTIDEDESLLYKAVDRVIALSGYTQKFLCSEYHIDPSKITVFPNGLDDISLELETDRDMLRRKWRISENEFVILFVGRLHPVKGLIFLIRAFRKVLETIPDCRLIIAGNGQFDSYMEGCEDIYAKVTWTGLLSKKKLYELYSIADIGVMPSFHEQCSYVAIEMMRHGIPLIVSASAGLNEMVEEGKSGLHVPVIEYPDKMDIDTTLLTGKMIHLLQNTGERQRMRINARQRYLEKYALPVFKKNMLDFYHSLINRL